VTGGLWPAELSAATPENGTLADYLRADLQRITTSANDELKIIKRAGMPDPVRQAEEARVIDEARARAVQRVESTVRHLHAVRAKAPTANIGRDFADRQAIPAADEEFTTSEPQEPGEKERNNAPVAGAVAGPAVDEENKPQAAEGRHRADYDAPASKPTTAPAPEAVEPAVAGESDDERLRRLLAFVAHQEPRLIWAVGARSDGTAVLVTDLAHGWIPPGIALPSGVRLLEPARRTGRLSALVGETTRTATYAPGDSLGRPDDFAETIASARPRELPAVEDPGWELSQATHWRDGLPRMVHTLARAAAAGTGVAEEEIDLLRVHLDTARYELVSQYPDVDPALLLNCLLLAATEGAVTEDPVSVNYHLAWFQKLSAPADEL
jgi:hypothetical protein